MFIFNVTKDHIVERLASQLCKICNPHKKRKRKKELTSCVRDVSSAQSTYHTMIFIHVYPRQTLFVGI